MRKIDAHCHFDPEYDSSNQPDVMRYVKLNQIDYSKEGILKDMEETGITHTVLISEHFERNEHFKQLAEKYPDKFSAVATFNKAKNIQRATSSLKNDFKSRAYVGLKFYLGYHRIVVTDKKWDRVYKLALKYDFPIIFHTGDTLGPKAYLKYAHPLALDELAVKYSKLKIVLAHLGNPWTLDAAEVVFKNPNVYADLSAFIIGRQKIDKYLIHRVNVALAYCGTEKVMFGTDYPLIRQRDYVKFTERLDLTQKQLEDVFYNNAKRLFRLEDI